MEKNDIKKGNLSIHSENIFPIIKKWLYSDHDIFIRELISNASDAITKMKTLVIAGEAEKGDEEYQINVVYDKDNGKIIIEDNGIGMTAEEIDEYINKIAFSGAEDFVRKFKDKGVDEQIIGHFGLGFYSAFMVASNVEIDTLSYIEGADAAKWSCYGGTEFEMSKGTRDKRGTAITLTLSEDGEDFKNEYKIKNTIHKYCSFMPCPIYFETVPAAESTSEAAEAEEEKPERKPLNTVRPLYLENPSSITDEMYIEFYRNTFVDFTEPLFWIHLNMDYPFNLKGILYFPKIDFSTGEIEGKIKLYNSQVFVADNIKEVIPEFLLLLKGVIDCPDIPLNVSRSFLQNDGFVDKIADYISRKVSDKLVSIFKTDRDKYAEYWDDIGIFIKYGSLRDEKFFDRIKDAIIYKLAGGGNKTLDELIADKSEDVTVYYSSDVDAQKAYIDLISKVTEDIAVLDEPIDHAFISLIESKHDKVRFKRVDGDIAAISEDDTDFDPSEDMTEAIKKALGIEDIVIDYKKLKSENVAAVLVEDEEKRRFQDMMRNYSNKLDPDVLKRDETLVLNTQNPLIVKLLEVCGELEDKDEIFNTIYDLALISSGKMDKDRIENFVKRSQDLMLKNLEK